MFLVQYIYVLLKHFELYSKCFRFCTDCMDARVENTEEEGKREAGNDDMLQKYINKFSKSELQEALIQVLYDGPEWQFERFINEHIKW